jgi:hypothetical protein
MPLSEHERRQLEQIEQAQYAMSGASSSPG